MYTFQCDDFGPIKDIENINFTLEEPEIEDILDMIIGEETDCKSSEDLEDYCHALERYYQIANNLPEDGTIDDYTQAELKAIAEIMGRHARLAVEQAHAMRTRARGNIERNIDTGFAPNVLLCDEPQIYPKKDTSSNKQRAKVNNEKSIARPIYDNINEEEPCLDNLDTIDNESTRIAKNKLKEYDKMMENFDKN